MERRPSRLLTEHRPGLGRSVLLMLTVTAAATLAVYPLKEIAPAVSLGVVYLLGVLLVSTYSGLWLGLLSALAGALAFNFFHIPPVHRFTIRDSENWVALFAFVIVAAIASSVAEVARSRAQEAERRRREADLAADLAEILLGSGDRAASLQEAAALVADAVGAGEAVIEVPARPEPPGREKIAIDLVQGAERVGRLLVSGRLDPEADARLREHLGPALAALVGVALQRDVLQAEAVETAALRRSDELKTALLRMVSHDLRSPLTAIVTAGHALQSESIEPADRAELARGVVLEADRLARMVENLLDLSRLEAGAAEPHAVELAIEEVLEAAVEPVREHVALRMSAELPMLRADGGQLERAFANVVENAVKYAGERTVQVRAGLVGSRIVVRIVDQGRGLSTVECARLFDAFHRGANAAPNTGSGLGLAIAKGFVEANGGEIKVESVPGQGTSFVVTFPVPETVTVTA